MHRSHPTSLLLLASILLMLAAPLLAQPEKDPDRMEPVPVKPAEAMDRGCAEGRKLFEAGKFAEALPLLTAYLNGNANPQAIDEIFFMQGRCQYETKQYVPATTSYLWIMRNCITSRLVPEAGVELCRTFIATKNDGGLDALREEARTRWGHTSFIGQIAELTFQYRMGIDPQVALDEQKRAITSGLLTPALHSRTLMCNPRRPV